MRLKNITRSFFRTVRNDTLKRYFTHQNVLLEHDFSKIPETKIEPIYQLYLAIEDNKKAQIEREFAEIQALANEGGVKAILDEARIQGEALAEELAKQEDFYQKVFWVYFNRPQYWKGACQFYHVDSIALNRWNEYRTIASVQARTDEDSLKELAQQLGAYFLQNEGRGKHCVVEYYKRSDLDYFFIYLADYPIALMELKNGQFDRTTHQPAFEIIIVYSAKDQKVSLHCKTGGSKTKKEVQCIFAEVILGLKQDEMTQNNKVFNLDPLLDQNKSFQFQPESGIQSVAVKKLIIMVQGSSERITLEADPSVDTQAVYHLMQKTCQSFKKSRLNIKRTTLVVTFFPDNKGKSKTCTFEVGWPNTCTLQHHKHEAAIRQMLIDSGIDI